MRLLYGNDSQIKLYNCSNCKEIFKTLSYNGICTIDKYEQDRYYICNKNEAFMLDFDGNVLRQDKFKNIIFKDICFSMDLSLYGTDGNKLYINSPKSGNWVSYSYRKHTKSSKYYIMSLKSSITSGKLFLQTEKCDGLSQIMLLDLFRCSTTIVNVDDSFSDFVVDYKDSSKLYPFNQKNLMRFDIIKNVTDMEFRSSDKCCLNVVASCPIHKNRVLVGGSGGQMNLIDTNTGTSVLEFSTLLDENLSALTLGEDSQAAVGFEDGQVMLFDLRFADKTLARLHLSDIEPIRNLMFDTKVEKDTIGFDLGDNRFDDGYDDVFYDLNAHSIADQSCRGVISNSPFERKDSVMYDTNLNEDNIENDTIPEPKSQPKLVNQPEKVITSNMISKLLEELNSSVVLESRETQRKVQQMRDKFEEDLDMMISETQRELFRNVQWITADMLLELESRIVDRVKRELNE